MVNRGQIWIVDFNPGYGREIRKKRPALVISIDTLNKNLPTITVIPLSSQIGSPGPEKVSLSKEEANLDKDSALLVASIRAVDKDRFIKRIGLVSREKMFEVEESLKLVLGLTPLE